MNIGKERAAMARKDMKSALGASIQAEEKAVRDRFRRAEEILGDPDVHPASGSAPACTTAPVERVARDSFTMPHQDYALIQSLRDRCLQVGVSVTKSEVLRAGLRILSDLSDHELRQVVERLVKVKTGRPQQIT